MDFEIKAIHVLGPALATAAMFVIGRNLVRKESGKNINGLGAVILFASAILFHLFFGDSTFMDRVAILLLDFGIAMILGSTYLAYNRVHPKVFFGLGMVTLVSGGIIWLSLHFIGFMWNGLQNGFCKAETNQVLLELGPDDQISELKTILEKYDALYEDAFPEVDLSEDEDLAQYYLITIRKGDVEDFMDEVSDDKENVDFVGLNYQVELFRPVTGHVEQGNANGYLANDPRVSEQWWLPQGRLNEVHELLKNRGHHKKARVAIVDTGVDSDHEDLKDIFVNSPGNSDPHGHGTHCAGIAGAATNNKTGIASLNWNNEFIEISGYHALGKDGFGTIETVAQAIIDAAEGGADVISMSLGGPHRKAPKAEVDAVEYALSLGCIVVVAAGNSNADAKYYAPANVPGVIVVSATDHSGSKAGFSNTNTSLEMPIAAPGVDILSCVPGSQYAPKSGTSMATPVVAGVLGIMRAIDPQLTPKEAWQILRETGEAGKDAKKVGNTVSPEKAILRVMERKGSVVY
ncbi:MAG: S8 family serine peptidase [Bacteroidia bacterium]|nr:S8 family serine peptidase [Bacteroidia bacterium]